MSDVVLIVVSTVLGHVVASTLGTPQGWPQWLAPVEQIASFIACATLLWRRSHPVVVAIILVVAGTFLTSVSLAPLFALYAVAALCPAKTTTILTAANLVAVVGPLTFRPDLLPSPVLLLSTHVVGVVSATALGLVVKSRWELVQALQARAVAAETEAQLRASQAEHEAREELAREMHDVLGHRLSLLSIQAGALSYNRNPSAGEADRAVEEIRRSAGLALQDLREVLGILRSPQQDGPSPRLRDVPALVAEVAASGTVVEVVDENFLTSRDSALSAIADRTLFRFVQEGLTNVRKHSPGGSATLIVRGRRGDGVVAEIRNQLPVRVPASTSTGSGLTGLVERAALVGGHVEYGPTPEGQWCTRIRLPWPS